MKMISICRKIILCFVVLLFEFPFLSFAADGCTYGDSKEVRIKTSVNIISVVDVKYCGGDDGGYVSIAMLTGKKVQRYKFSIENRAYFIDVDSEIDLKNDGGHGLGVTNGRGRSGDGM
ncbi:hypothetical protein [Burkholderia ubonensis]|nr:hypothetical protein [Burkholderia ubonensis]